MGVAVNQKKRLGNMLKSQREKEKKSLRGLAADCDMSYATLNDIENGNGFPTEKTVLRIVEKLNFTDKTKIYDLYATIKDTAPPDVIEYLSQNRPAVEDVRQRMNKEKGATE